MSMRDRVAPLLGLLRSAAWADQRRRASVRTHLLMVVMACVLPATAAAVFGLTSAYHTMYATLTDQGRANSRAMAKAVDGVISTAVDRLQRMASSPELATADVAGFGAFARRLQPYQSGNNLVLTDAGGRQLVNTALPPGAALPMHGAPSFQRSVIASGRPAVSDLFVGGALKQPLVAIEVPVRRGDAIPYTLAMGFLPERFARIIAEHQPEPDWVVSIFDSTGTIVARTHEADRFVGSKGAPALLAAMARNPQHGVVRTRTLEGTPVIAVYTSSESAHWTVAVGIPESLLIGRLERWITMLVAFSAGMLVLGSVLAQGVSMRIAGAIRALLAPAQALGRGEPVQPVTAGVTEAQLVADALVQASALLRARTRERDQATQARQAIQVQARAFEHAASHDPLTGLPNRARFMDALQECIERHSQSGGAFAVVFIDIDDFKPVNDVHGHSIGDELLCAFAARLRGAFRGQDLVARLAGDEFAVVVDGRSAAELDATATELLAALSRPYGIGSLTLRVRASAGIASYPVDGLDARSLLDAADLAMYRAKAAGKRARFEGAGHPPRR